MLALFLAGAERDKLDPILDACVATYLERLDEDGQVDFKGKAKAFRERTSFSPRSCRTPTRSGRSSRSCSISSSPSCPPRRRRISSKGILEAIDMDSYRAEKKAAQKIALPDEDAEMEPVPTAGGGRKAEPELDRL